MACRPTRFDFLLLSVVCVFWREILILAGGIRVALTSDGFGDFVLASVYAFLATGLHALQRPMSIQYFLLVCHLDSWSSLLPQLPMTFSRLMCFGHAFPSCPCSESPVFLDLPLFKSSHPLMLQILVTPHIQSFTKIIPNVRNLSDKVTLQSEVTETKTEE